MRKKILITILFLAVCLLCACGGKDTADATPTPEPSPEPVTELTVVVDEAGLAALDSSYPDLEKLDLSGSVCYAAIADYIASHPGVEVSYTVGLGGGAEAWDGGSTALRLEPGSYEPGALMSNLAYLPALESLELPMTGLDAEQIAELSLVYPDIDISYSVDILGQEFSSDTESLDLGAMTSDDVAAVCEKLPLLPALGTIAIDSQRLEMEDVAALMAAAPGAFIDYSFDFFGFTLSTSTKKVHLQDVEIGDEYEDYIRRCLDIMPECTYFCLDDCGMSNEVMASIRDSYPDKMIVWRVYFGEYFSMLTDEDTVRAIFDLYDGTTENLKYCTEVKYMDIGHNTSLTEVDFIAYMDKLEICIMSGSPFSDMSVFANCPNLDWLELVYCPNVSDVSSLAGLRNLRYLNLTYTQVTDISMLGSEIPLERFFYANPKLSAEQIAQFEEMHPDTWCTYDGFEYGYGWRYDDPGTGIFSEPYLRLREAFRYGENYYNTKHPTENIVE